MSVTRSPFRSPVRGPTQSPFGVSGLLERTRTFRDRVKGENGSIEDGSLEGLYDPILRTVKGFSGVGLSDLVFFGSGSAVEVNSGSIPKIFDGSGNENDAIQTTTADQPTLDKNGIGGRWEANADGGDSLRVPSGVADAFESGSEGTAIVVVRYNSPSAYVNAFALDDSGPFWIMRSNNFGEIVILVDDGSSGATVTGSTPSHPVTLIQSGRYDGSEVVVRENGAETGSASTSLGDSTYTGKEFLMRRSTGENIKGALACTIAFGTPLSNTQASKIEDKANTYYNNIY